jgi:hypothetical protein
MDRGEDGETFERKIDFSYGRLSPKFPAPDGSALQLYFKQYDEEEKSTNIPYATHTIPEDTERAILILLPQAEIASGSSKVIFKAISSQNHPPDSFTFINASGYQFMGHINREAFTLDKEIGTEKTIRFKPTIIERAGRENKVVVLAELAIYTQDKWSKLNGLTQYMNWREGMNKTYILVRDPNQQLQYDLNLVSLN